MTAATIPSSNRSTVVSVVPCVERAPLTIGFISIVWSRKEGHMRTTRLVLVSAIFVASGLALHVGRAQQAGITRTDLQRHDLSVAGREVVQAIVELDPGVTSSRHRHPGEEIVYVLDGAPLEYQVEGKPPVTLRPGGVLFIPAGAVHAAKNVGNRKGAELATYIVLKGEPLLTEVGDRTPK